MSRISGVAKGNDFCDEPAMRTDLVRSMGPLLGIALFVVACEPVRHYNRLQVAVFAGPGKVQRKPYGSIKVFETPDDVKRPYEVIGMMSCEGSAAEEAAI